MKPQELRIGNLAYKQISTTALEVHKITALDIVEQQFTNKFTPIELTEEWLLKFGFDYRGIYYHFPANELFKLDRHKLSNAWWLRHDGDLIDCIRINYVHQLQNLYFALTGEELTLKE